MADERAAEVTAVANAVLDELVADLVLSCTIAAHREIKRGRAICGICGTMCRSHTPLTSGSTSTAILQAESSSIASSSRAPSPSSQQQQAQAGPSSRNPKDRSGGYTTGPEKGTGGSTGIGSGSGKMDNSGNVFFECLVCSRSVVSSKYAPHLSGCLGLNGSTRRGASRSAAVKARLGTNDRSSPSPYIDGSQNGDFSDHESPNGKKGRKAVINGNGKRGGSPTKAALAKKNRLNGVNSGPATPSGTNRLQLPPSRLGRPPTTSQTLSQADRGSPASSPAKSVVSLPASQGSGASTNFGGLGGSTGTKTLPGVGGKMGSQAGSTFSGGDDADVVAMSVAPGEESDDPDDY